MEEMILAEDVSSTRSEVYLMPRSRFEEIEAGMKKQIQEEESFLERLLEGRRPLQDATGRDLMLRKNYIRVCGKAPDLTPKHFNHRDLSASGGLSHASMPLIAPASLFHLPTDGIRSAIDANWEFGFGYDRGFVDVKIEELLREVKGFIIGKGELYLLEFLREEDPRELGDEYMCFLSPPGQPTTLNDRRHIVLSDGEVLEPHKIDGYGRVRGIISYMQSDGNGPGTLRLSKVGEMTVHRNAFGDERCKNVVGTKLGLLYERGHENCMDLYRNVYPTEKI